MGDKNSKAVDTAAINWSARLDADFLELEKKKKKLKKDHPQVASALNKVATDYKNLADFSNALKYELESQEILKKIYPEQNHLILAQSFNFVSGCYSMLDKADQALDYSIKSYDTYQRFHKKPHANTARQLANVSTCCKNSNDFEKALLYASKCLKMRQDLYPNDNHIDLAYSYSDIGFLYGRIGYVDSGIKFSLKALEIYNRLKTDYVHIDLANLYNNIAMDFRTLGNHEKSIFYLKKSIEVVLCLYSGNCYQIASSLHSYAIGLKYYDDYANCLKYSLISVKMFEKLDEKEMVKKYESEIAELCSLAAMSYFYLNDRQNCLIYSLESLRHYEKFLDSKHPKLARLKNNISVAYGNLGDGQKALDYAQQALKSYTNLYFSNHVDVARSLANVGAAYGNLADPFMALKYCQKALEMLKSLYEGNNNDLACALYNVACCYDDLGDKQNFLKFTLDSLKMHKELADHKDNVDTIMLLKNASIAYFKLNDALNSLKYAKEALKMAKNMFREPHPMIAVCLFCIAKSYRVSGDLRLEHENFIKALEMKNILKHLFDFDISFDMSMEKFKFDPKQFRYKLKKNNETKPIKNHIVISYYGDILTRHECIEIKEILEKKDYRVYVDLSESNKKSLDKMTEAIDKSTIVIVCLNEKYVKDDFCKLESAYAIKQNKKIIPIIIEPNTNSPLITEWLDHYRLEEKHCIFFKRYSYDNFSKIFLNEVNIKLNIISTDESLVESNLEDMFRKNQVNSNLLNKLRPINIEVMRNLAKLDSSLLEHVFNYFKSDSADFTSDDSRKFKLCLNQIFV
ncbi:tetratricopeptide repeat [Brachionus plicatilis]|uniref:Tetratricopeptide repeat n=1 Tax=Brachionus plicatilis TaxID=10195 RepID=A0A3M7RKY1_BRAPC|nr:tetratricopeptide repeat [Brachionus plicatilis]